MGHKNSDTLEGHAKLQVTVIVSAQTVNVGEKCGFEYKTEHCAQKYIQAFKKHQ